MNPQQARERVAETFPQPFNGPRFLEFTRNLLNKFDESKAAQWNATYVKDAFKPHVARFERLGTYTSPDDEKLDVLIVHLTNESKLERARTAIRNFVADHLKTRDEKDAALVAFVSPTERHWRFSYVKMEYAAVETESGKVGVETRLTPARRYSYIVGEGESCHTAQSRFLALLQDTENYPTLAQLAEAFSVEAVTREFFNQYASLFGDLEAALQKLAAKDLVIGQEFKTKNVSAVDFAKKLMGQIVFLYFLQKKGWLGVAKGQDWGTGPHDFLRRLVGQAFSQSPGVNIFNDVLEPLFYDTLATDRGHAAWCNRFKCRIPFLNGGLFEPLADYDWRKIDILLPNKLFTNTERVEKTGDTGTGILDVFDRYNFTVNEAEPLEKEVAIDPEMLGKVFENLIEENRRKGLGSFYTPREIVHYMCQESLINYLDTALNSDVRSPGFSRSADTEPPTGGTPNATVPRADLETFIHLGDQISHYEAVAAEYRIKMPKSVIAHARLMDDKLADITVCDPAVGSGAFPVGMMSEIVRARCALTPYFNDVHDRTPYHFKRHAIQSSLYGVDIDPGAVEIAKLRLWLSLVVDEEDMKQIKPLPNLFYKIVTGNSLLGVEKNLFNQQLFQKLEKLKPLYFDQSDQSKKSDLRRQIEDTIHELTNGKAAFDFEIYFSEVFHRKGGFDVVIGNPPYGAEFSPALIATLRASYESVANSLDSFILFIERAAGLLKPHGALAYLVPSGWVSTPSSRKLRALFVRSFKPLVFASLPYDSFATAYVDTMVVMAQRLAKGCSWADLPEKRVRLVIFPIRHSIASTKDFERFQKQGDFSLWKNPADAGFLVLASKAEAALIGKLRACPKCFDDYVEVMRGIEIYHPTKRDQCRYPKAALTGDIYRYQLIEGPPGYIDYPPEIESSKSWRFFGGARILLRQLISRKFRLQAVIVEKPFLTNQSVQSLVVRRQNAPSLHILLAILNSRLLSWFFCQVNMVARRDDFPKIIIKQTRELPIPNLDLSAQIKTCTELNKLVYRILAAKQRDAEADVSALEREIDELVYALYGLTPEEIQIVERAAK